MLCLTWPTAKNLGPDNITVKEVCPGFVLTNFWHILAQKLAEVDPAYARKGAREVFDLFIAYSTPMQRAQSPQDIRNVVSLPASDEARNVTGQTINVSGGMVLD